MLPFSLAAAGGDKALARAAIIELAEDYNAATAVELELVGRILGFSTVAMDNLRVSMDPDMSDTKVLRYRSNAVALSRASEECRRILETIQAKRGTIRTPMSILRPDIAPAPAPKPAASPPASAPAPTLTTPPASSPAMPPAPSPATPPAPSPTSAPAPASATPLPPASATTPALKPATTPT